VPLGLGVNSVSGKRWVCDDKFRVFWQGRSEFARDDRYRLGEVDRRRCFILIDSVRSFHTRVISTPSLMPDSEGPSLVILLSSCGGLLILILFLMFRVLLRLKRLERQLDQISKRAEPAQAAPSQAETSPGGAFEAFLAEDPERRNMPKGEQFSAYRQWRQEKGMNWSNS